MEGKNTPPQIKNMFTALLLFVVIRNKRVAYECTSVGKHFIGTTAYHHHHLRHHHHYHHYVVLISVAVTTDVVTNNTKLHTIAHRFSVSYRAVLVKLSPLTKGCLSLMHSFSVTSVNVAINHTLLKTKLFGLQYSTVAALHKGAPSQMTWLEDPPPWLRPAYSLLW